MTVPSLYNPPPSFPPIPSLLSTPHSGHLATPEKPISTIVMTTEHCNFIVAGIRCPCQCGEFDLQPGVSPDTPCTICQHSFRDHDVTAVRATIVEAASVCPKPAPAQLTRPAKRVCPGNDFHRSSVPGERRPDNLISGFSFL